VTHSPNFLPVDEAVRILEDCGYRVERHANRMFLITEPGKTVRNMMSLRSIRIVARSLWLVTGVQQNLSRSGLTTARTFGTLPPCPPHLPF
jgi:hypothetical protein